MVKIDFESDYRFRDSLADLGSLASIDVFAGLEKITSQQYSWEDFTKQFGWEPIALTGSDIFPGGNELHQFILAAPSAQRYKIFGYTYENVVIICAVVRKA
ncbi:hypothetical protein [Duganella sp. BuS-21]|uniref:hypothetical protein n=1 Tax=Duganella sp. BuS-21 TaxID=2943848 RepID=UPI0035A62E01